MLITQITSKFGELWSHALQQLWPWSRLKVKVMAWCQLKGLVTRIMHAKYQCSIINTSEDMSQVKVFVTDRRMEERDVPHFYERQGTIRINHDFIQGQGNPPESQRFAVHDKACRVVDVANLWHESGFTCRCTKSWLIIFLLTLSIPIPNPHFCYQKLLKTFSC